MGRGDGAKVPPTPRPRHARWPCSAATPGPCRRLAAVTRWHRGPHRRRTRAPSHCFQPNVNRGLAPCYKNKQKEPRGWGRGGLFARLSRPEVLCALVPKAQGVPKPCAKIPQPRGPRATPHGCCLSVAVPSSPRPGRRAEGRSGPRAPRHSRFQPPREAPPPPSSPERPGRRRSCRRV